ncbi:MAG: hypothetical protein GY862_26735 [Gammaproteobacteria bacterium]|nr:hypothetical protein [Gammaproteobacteria bacterium]
MNNREQQLAAQLRHNITLLKASVSTLRLSFDKCREIGVKPEYSFSELESFDSLTSKFARCSDIFTQKVLKTVFMLLREEAETFVDRANLAEKLDLVTCADDIIAIRDLRNQITHEYVQEHVEALFGDVLALIDKLLASVEKTRQTVKARNWLENNNDPFLTAA